MARQRRIWTFFITGECSVGSRGVEEFLSKKLELVAGKMLKRKTMSEKVTRFDEAQQAAFSTLQKIVKYSRKLNDSMVR